MTRRERGGDNGAKKGEDCQGTYIKGTWTKPKWGRIEGGRWGWVGWVRAMGGKWEQLEQMVTAIF